MAHHTKDKGDLAVGMVVSDLLVNGYDYAPLMSEHLPFDLIAINPENGDLRKLQIKYRTLSKNGSITVALFSSHADRHGSHVKPVDRSMFDAYAIYCREIHQIYYIKTSEVPNELSVRFVLRVTEPKNGQKAGIRMASDFVGVDRIF